MNEQYVSFPGWSSALNEESGLSRTEIDNYKALIIGYLAYLKHASRDRELIATDMAS